MISYASYQDAFGPEIHGIERNQPLGRTSNAQLRNEVHPKGKGRKNVFAVNTTTLGGQTTVDQHRRSHGGLYARYALGQTRVSIAAARIARVLCGDESFPSSSSPPGRRISF